MYFFERDQKDEFEIADSRFGSIIVFLHVKNWLLILFTREVEILRQQRMLKTTAPVKWRLSWSNSKQVVSAIKRCCALWLESMSRCNRNVYIECFLINTTSPCLFVKLNEKNPIKSGAKSCQASQRFFRHLMGTGIYKSNLKIPVAIIRTLQRWRIVLSVLKKSVSFENLNVNVLNE